MSYESNTLNYLNIYGFLSYVLTDRSRGGRSGPDYREYRGGAGASRGYSPVRGEGPPSKRIRPDWPLEDRRYGAMPHDSYGSYGWAHDHFGPHPAHQGYGQPMPPVPARLDFNYNRS